MIEPVPTPTFENDPELAGFQYCPAYDPQAALVQALAAFPAKFKPDMHWLALVLICENAKELTWILGYVDWQAGHLSSEPVLMALDILSAGQYVLARLALHLFNDCHELPPGGLTHLRRLDAWHFDLAMHAIRLHSRGVR